MVQIYVYGISTEHKTMLLFKFWDRFLEPMVE